MVDMVRKNYLPAMERYLHRLADTTRLMKSVSENVKCNYEITTMERLSELTDDILAAVKNLEDVLAGVKKFDNAIDESAYIRDDLIPSMDKLRKYVDEAEMLTSARDWPFPSYGEILFSVY